MYHFILVINLIKEINIGDWLTFSGLLLAYLAYTWSVNRDFESWRSLLFSLKYDLEFQRAWLDSEYFTETYKDKKSFDPFKIIFPLSFESLSEISLRIFQMPNIPEKLIENLKTFNGRVKAFNLALDHMRGVVSADSIKSEKLRSRLKELGIDNKEVSFDDLQKNIHELKEREEILFLAENIRRLNRYIHVDLIGNKGKKDKLHYLYLEITKGVKDILINFDSSRPFFIKYQIELIALFSIGFLLVEFYFNQIPI